MLHETINCMIYIFKIILYLLIFQYAIRFPATMHNTTSPEGSFGMNPRWLTEFLYDLFQLPRSREQVDNETEDIASRIHLERGGRPGYWREGFLFLQATVDTEIARHKAEKHSKPPGAVDDYNILLNRYPYPTYIDDGFIAALQLQFPLFLMLSFIYPIINIAKSVTYEKEKRLKESMKIMGLPNWLHWSAWFTKSVMFLLISIILLTILYKVRKIHSSFINISRKIMINKKIKFYFFISYAIFLCLGTFLR